MAAPENGLKAALLNGKRQEGLWLNLQSALTAEIAGRAGFDWCLVDGEHAPFAPEVIQSQLIALEGTGSHGVVRVPDAQDWMIKQVLDIGAQSVLVPMINTAEAAQGVVAATRYPPAGLRGMGGIVARAGRYGGVQDYAATANDQICVLVQAETRQALDNLPQICAVEGVDVVFIGPADLAADMGHGDNLAHKDVQEAVDHGLRVIHAAGKISGIIALAPEMIAHYRSLGVGFLGVGSDALALSQSLARLKAGG